MADNLESRIGMALRATHFQMQMSDAKEGLSHMHEQVESLRQFGNPLVDIERFYGLHFEISSFLRHLGFAEFSEEPLRQAYNQIVTAIFYPKVADDPVPRANALRLRVEKELLQGSLQKAEQWLQFFTTHNPEDYSDEQAMIQGLPSGVYFGKAGDDLVDKARVLQNYFLRRAKLDEETLDLMYRAASSSAAEGIDKKLAELEACEKENLGIARRLSLIIDGRFSIPGVGILGAIDSNIGLLMGNYAGTWLKINALKTLQREGYPLDHLPKVRKQIEGIWGESGETLGLQSPKFFDFWEGFRAADMNKSAQYAADHQKKSQKRRDKAVYSATPDILYHLLKRVQEFRSQVEQDLRDTVQEIRQQHPEKIEYLAETKKRATEQLGATIKNSEGWERAWKVNYDGVHECDRLKIEAIQHPWLANRHPTYNTSAYSAKLTALSAQLEAIQNGIVSPHLRLLP